MSSDKKRFLLLKFVLISAFLVVACSEPAKTTAANYDNCSQKFQVFCQDRDIVMFDKPVCEAYIRNGELLVRLQGEPNRKIARANNCRLWPYSS